MSEHPTGLRERKRQRTYRAISDAAVALFLEKGFDRVSVSEIAEAAEVSKPTLFRYFPAKEDMALHRFADHEDEAARVVTGRPDGRTPLTALEEHFLAGLRAHDPVTGLCDAPEVLAFHRLLYGTPSLLARLHTYTARSEEALAAALERAAPDAERTALTARVAAGQIVSTQRVLATGNWRQIADGAAAAALLPRAERDAHHAFALLRTGLAAYR
ncbi:MULTISPECIES: TetR/AcrR family transcriptional regulator [Streptomyces]|uniref:TetR family transcriptional regulator n=1 Tax=Streptomyces cacaoi TaxID=1898 RepID=A0A4Y3QR07_STRCI|nr:MULTISPECIES: TetR family transcriptional regulator [Streptomyces]NNG85223.1 TetR/AcrR family transcriptional regulator [Streptomyces cacaoi]QHF95857.1 TetR family transcriptional regulator [Streptomyces sp. NHF165]GEB47641.1 TetR family transcriptional regulator [Streptomyces cacaoi]